MKTLLADDPHRPAARDRRTGTVIATPGLVVNLVRVAEHLAHLVVTVPRDRLLEDGHVWRQGTQAGREHGPA